MGFLLLENSAKYPIKAKSSVEACVVCGAYKVSSIKKQNKKGTQDIVSFTVRPSRGRLPNVFKQALTQCGYCSKDSEFTQISALGCNGKITNTDKAVSLCLPRVKQAVESVSPMLVVVHGETALQAWFQGRANIGAFSTYRGTVIPDIENNTWVCPIYDGQYINAQRQEDSVLTCYVKDVDRIVALMCDEEPFSVFSLDELREFQPDDNKYIHCLTDFSEVITYLNNFDKDSFVFDIETTGLKPFVNGHKIVSFACGSLDTKDVYSFPIEYPNIFSVKEQRAIFTAIRKILENPNIKKIAHNLQFEHVWCKVIFGANTVGWYEDTMLKSRILDNRSKFAGLKHQSFVRLGIMPYDSFIKPYLDSGKEQFNKICRAPLEQLLYYGGIDVLATGAISKYYAWAMPEPSEAYNLLHAGTLSFAELQLNGMGADLDYYQTKNVQLQKEIAQKKATILETEEAISFKETYHKPIDIASPKDLGELVYDVLKFPPVLTDKNNYCVDVDALSKIDNAFVQQLLKIRKLEKIQGTYLSQFLRNIVNNRIHAMFGLGTAVTYRSSSSNPNWQNIPIRDNLAKQICRGGLVPSKGNLLIEADYSGVEVRIGVCYHKDPNMITYITDPTTDMHRDTAADLWLLNADEVTKEIRQSGKGDWVFPQFYGSWYLECGKNAWETCINGNLKLKDGRPLRDHIAEHGITCVDDFIEHCKDVENIFWGTRFKGYSDWRKEIHKFYMKNGYVETYLGFRYQGYMTRNETSNYPIQGTAFHCLLTTLIRLINKAKEEKWKSKFIGQIHDSLIVDVVPEEKDYVIETIHNIGTKELMDLYDWIIVPIEMDFEITDIDQPWSTKKEI